MRYVRKKIFIFAEPNHVAEALRVEVCGWAVLHTGVYCAFVSTCRNPENSNVSQKQSNGTPLWCIISACAKTLVANGHQVFSGKSTIYTHTWGFGVARLRLTGRFPEPRHKKRA